MNPKDTDLHGNVPDTSPVALLIIDMINDLEFPGGDELAEPARVAAEHIAVLKRRAKALGIPVIYVNDNFGRWRSDFKEAVDHVRNDGVRGEFLASILSPESDDYVVLKPKHSSFYVTTLDTLLVYLQTKHLILTGMTTDSCILFTANDAYMRDFNISIPSDCVAAIKPTYTNDALAYMKRLLGADVTPSSQLDLATLCQDVSLV
ncbi:cysteine hydrolase family protein [Spirosoma validum]|uniref:Cysteine hydrolase n=1 Tax=Spirosoma validum TaxID=2771355 RepID=A0A927B277_9BACT|nr:isochorismatase family cysteine hydrolase [Spirosoma validum]MBD2754019.1 cysteine hydrolase [Spirosoma validum]